VVEDAPAPKRPARPEVLDPDFEVVDEPKPKRRASTRDDDDEDDRPRGRRRRDDDDDDDDRPRRKKSRRRVYEEEEEDDWQPAVKPGAGAAKVGILLIVISLWLYLGTFAFLLLLLLIAWLGASIPNGLLIVPGLLGLTNWVVALVGLGFCIAGPARARGLAIAATAVSAVHLIMCFIVANDTKSVLFASRSIQSASSYNKLERFTRLSKAAAKNPNGPEAKELQEELKNAREDRDNDLIGLSFAVQALGSQADRDIRGDLDRAIRERDSESKMRWLDLATLFPFSDRFVAILAYQSSLFSDYILSFLSGLLEIARLILLILTIGAVARAVKGHQAADRAQVGWITTAIAAGVAILVCLLIAVIQDSNASDFKKAVEKAATTPPAPNSSSDEKNPFTDFMRSAKNWNCAQDLILLSLHGGVLIVPILAAHGAYSAAARRAR
jgi:hypothetical protein